eukprot:2255140-Amphidinium_carterae.1
MVRAEPGARAWSCGHSVFPHMCMRETQRLLEKSTHSALERSPLGRAPNPPNFKVGPSAEFYVTGSPVRPAAQLARAQASCSLSNHGATQTNSIVKRATSERIEYR